MPPAALDDATLLATVAAVADHGGINGASVMLGMPRSTIQSRLQSATRRGLCVLEQQPGGIVTVADMNAARLDIPDVPDELPSADELIERRKTQYARKAGRTADRAGVSPEQAWAVYFLKHIDAITSIMTKPDAAVSEAPIGRFADAINYLLLGWALLQERDQ